MRLILENKSKYLTRPIAHMTLGFIIGIIGGNMFLNEKYVSSFFIPGLLSVGAFYYLKYRYKGLMIILIGSIAGILLLTVHPLRLESHYFEPGNRVQLEGEVYEVQNTAYGQYISIKHVTLYKEKHKVQLRSSLQLSVNTVNTITPYDWVDVRGTVEAIEGAMNPSDFNDITYLKTKNIVGRIKVEEILTQDVKTPWIEKLQNKLKSKLDELFQGKDQGIMKALLLGDDTALEASTDKIYTDSGISHVLCISGFHVSVIAGFLLLVMGQLGMSYTLRYLIVLLGIWLYAYLTGWGVSTLRATWMMSFLVIGRLIWEEEDGWINLALASLCILIVQPYQLFAVGFQLSFLAMVAIIISQIIIEHLEEEKKMKLWHKWLLPWLPIQLILSLPLTYHFYQVPFLSSLLNFIVIPLFSLIMIGGWGCLLMGLFDWPLGYLLASVISLLLQVISFMVRLVLSVPLSTICVGRPSGIELLLYIIVIGLFLYGVWGIGNKIKLYACSCLLTFSLIVGIKVIPKELNVAFLYVGQGDGSVIITPKGQVIVIDGGKTGKGGVIERYLKYKGKTQIDMMILSHSDEDHIGGLIELISGTIGVKQVCISKADESENLVRFKEQCRKKQIPILAMGRGDQLILGDLKLTALAPNFTTPKEIANDNSLVCMLQYKAFSALFTGDKSKDSESWIYSQLNPISILKISHHGSRTGTSKELLLKVNPVYAMISCGRQNRYGHPHKEVTDLLTENHITYSQTNETGAVWIETNGYKMKINKQREDLEHDAGMLFTARGR